VNDDSITELRWVVDEAVCASKAESSGSVLLTEAAKQLDAYFAGRLTTFDLPLCPVGSEFQRQVYRAMSAIPYGETLTYGEIARNLDSYAQPQFPSLFLAIASWRPMGSGGTRVKGE
jgi:methylated-DNA-[protein]-cysteine S-methyltransferase